MAAEIVDLPDPRLRQLVTYWLELRGERIAPSRAALDPADMRSLLPWVALLDVAGDGFNTRLAGTGLEGMCGRALTGTRLDEKATDPLEGAVLAWLRHACTERAPLAMQATLAGRRSRLLLGAVVLPLSSDGLVIDKLLCGCVATGVTISTVPMRPRGEGPATLVEFSARSLMV